MSSQGIDELKSLVTETLKKRGVLGKFKAQLRKAVISALETDANGALYAENPKAAAICADPQGLLLAELIREYLQFHDLEYSESVFTPEANLPPTPEPREQLEARALPGGARRTAPLLAQILEAFLTKPHEPGGAARDPAESLITPNGTPGSGSKTPLMAPDRSAVERSRRRSSASSAEAERAYADEFDPAEDFGSLADETAQSHGKALLVAPKPTVRLGSLQDDEVEFSDHSATEEDIERLLGRASYVEDFRPPDPPSRVLPGDDDSDSDRF
jgi:hypothetical protein